MRRFTVELGFLTLLLPAMGLAQVADHDAVITGVVRDARGIPQMGALVQILSASNSAIRATTFTDLQGRYSVRSLLPGRYGVRASAALFLPVSRDNLRLQPDRRAVVNLTLSSLFDEAVWFPARTKGSDELTDDWNWTLRSSAGRPILKLDEDGAGAVVAGVEGPSRPSVVRIRAEAKTASRGFGEGVARAGVRVRTVHHGGLTATFESSLGEPGAAAGQPATVSTSIERPLGTAGLVGTKVSYASHPEITDGGGGVGMSVVSVATAERFVIGDLAEVEAGSRVQAISGPVSAMVTRPFLRVSTQPAEHWTVTYRLATDPDLQDYDSAMGGGTETPIATRMSGQAAAGGANRGVVEERSLHQEFAVARRTRATLLELAYFADAMDNVVLSGVQGVTAADVAGEGLAAGGRTFGGLGLGVGNGGGGGVLPGPGSAGAGAASLDGAGFLNGAAFLMDASNGSFRALTKGYHSAGFNILLTRAIGEHTWVALQYCAGTAMAAPDAHSGSNGWGVASAQPRRSEAATVAVKVNLARTGTRVRASYRWQPDLLVTTVDPYDALAGGGYLGFHVRQPLVLPGVLPEGLELTMDGTNVLSQGYQRVQERGGIPLYLAASPSTMRAGVAFSF